MCMISKYLYKECTNNHQNENNNKTVKISNKYFIFKFTVIFKLLPWHNNVMVQM